ncbi:MAG: hypothetical protein M3389_10620, partial [Actinomycetota bacterium]|nr:hypothetical protein [Actinomycetota bacterium]
AHGGPGDDEMRAVGRLFGDAGADTMSGGALDGGPGDDRLEGTASGSGPDDLTGGEGDDQIAGQGGLDHIDGGPGNDRLYAPGPGDPAPEPDVNFGGGHIVGGDGDDIIVGTEHIDKIRPGAGDDTVVTGGGPEIVFGEQGDDRLVGGSDIDRLNGGPGRDVLLGEGDEDVLAGGEGDDVLDGGPGRDQLSGGRPVPFSRFDSGCFAYEFDALPCPVDVRAEGPEGADTIRGGPDVDSLSYDLRARGVDVDLLAPGGDGEPGENDSVAPDVEWILGSPHDDVLRGGDGPERLLGGPGRDLVAGRGGDDSVDGDALYMSRFPESDPSNAADHLDGGAGNDWVEGEAGPDVLGGGEGDDQLRSGDSTMYTVDVVGLTHDDLVGCGTGKDAVYANPVDITSEDCEHVTVYPRLEPAPAGEAVSVDVRCGSAAVGKCSGRVELRAAGMRHRERIGIPAETRRRVTIALPRRLRSVVARRKVVRGRIVVTLRDLRGRTFRSSRAEVLRAG